MNLQSILITDMMGVLILIVLMISSYLVRQRRTPSDRLFTVMCVLTALSCTADFLAFAVDGQTYAGARTSAMFLNTFTYSTNIIISALWMLYVDLRLYGSIPHMLRILKRTFLPGTVGLICLIANLKWSFVYYLDEGNVYHRMPFSTVYFALTYFYLISSVFIRRSHRKRMGNTRFVPVWMFLVPIVLCTTAQFLIYGISLAWCSVAIGLVSMYMGLQNELAYLDPLTKLFNRTYLHNLLKQFSNMRREVRGIMIDLDHFKSINDTYGHDEGDAALSEAARIIKASVPENGVPIRFAGDEFLILIANGTEEEVAQTIGNIRREETVFNESKKKPYQLLFSLGTGILPAGGSTEEFLKEMDNRMYEQKKMRHESQAAKTE